MTHTLDPSVRASPPVGRMLIAALALLTAVAPLALDMYLPAFPQMADDLITTASGIQLTLTACLIGLRPRAAVPGAALRRRGAA